MPSFAHLRTRSRGASGESGPPGGPPVQREDREEGSSGADAVAALVLGVLSALLYAAITALGDLREHLLAFLVVYGALFVLFVVSLRWWWRVRRRRTVILGLAGAVVFRALLLPSPPTLSDDVQRYLWEGRVVRNGANPYLHPPADPALAHLGTEQARRVGHPEIASVYPPLAQTAFAVAGWRIGSWKIAVLLVDLGVVALLMALLRSLDLPAGRAMVHAWCPLVVVETAGSGHLEPLAVAAGLLAVMLMIGRRKAAAGAWLGVAAGVRLLHAAFGLAWWRRLGPRGWAAFAAAFLIPWLPFAAGGFPSGLARYARHWEHNNPLFLGVRRGLEALGPTEPLKAAITALRDHLGEVPGSWQAYFYTDVPTLARGVVLTAFLVWVLVLGWRRTPVLRAGYLAVGGFLLLSPTLHPWYVVQIVPFLAFFPSTAWLAFSGTVALSYLVLLDPQAWELPAWVLAAEYLPLWGLLLGGRLIRGGGP